jgi:hypothetical protein
MYFLDHKFLQYTKSAPEDLFIFAAGNISISFYYYVPVTGWRRVYFLSAPQNSLEDDSLPG